MKKHKKRFSLHLTRKAFKLAFLGAGTLLGMAVSPTKGKNIRMAISKKVS